MGAGEYFEPRCRRRLRTVLADSTSTRCGELRASVARPGLLDAVHFRFQICPGLPKGATARGMYVFGHVTFFFCLLL